MNHKVDSSWRIGPSVHTPLAILKERAAELKFLTEEKIIGSVDEDRRPDCITYLTLNVTPAIDGAKEYKILHAICDDSLYPIKVASLETPNFNNSEDCENEETLAEELNIILSSHKVAKLLACLIAQVDDQNKKKEGIPAVETIPLKKLEYILQNGTEWKRGIIRW